MGIMEKIKNFFTIKPPQSMQIDIEQLTNFEGYTFINKIWYRGEANELHQLYKQINENIENNDNFWGSTPSKHSNIRKIHTGLPAMIVDTLANISTDDLDKIETDRQEEWDSIDKENNIKELAREAVTKALWGGDGAFKWSIDTDISKYPIIEFYGADRVEFEYERGRLVAIIFKTKKLIKGKWYELRERYDKKGITYKLLDEDKKEVKLEKYEGFEKYSKPVINNAEFMMALPFILRKSDKFEGRGKPIFDGKLGSFDAYDEVWSNWMLSVRKGQMKEYIPDCFVPRDPKTGMVLRAKDFDNAFIVGSDAGENAKNTIMSTQGQIQHEALLSSYITALDQCLQGLISPSTLGIDVKKLDNAEAQREKEKTTLYRRNQIVEVLEETLKEIVNITFKVLDNMNNTPPTETEVTVTFGGYANPSFEAQVETISKASTSSIMSVEAQVEELWGDTKEEDWKAEEVKRIKYEKGIEIMDEPAINQDIDLIENEVDQEEVEK